MGSPQSELWCICAWVCHWKLRRGRCCWCLPQEGILATAGHWGDGECKALWHVERHRGPSPSRGSQNNRGEQAHERHREGDTLESHHCRKDPPFCVCGWLLTTSTMPKSLAGVRSWGQERLLPFLDSFLAMGMKCFLQGHPTIGGQGPC